jgi:hypothetical protein
VIQILIALLVTTGATAFALRPALAATSGMWLGIGVPYLLLAALALYDLWRQETLVEKIVPRWGDISIGIVIAAVLMFAGWSVMRGLLTPPGNDRQAWLLHVYLQLGPSDAIQHSALLTSAVLVCAALEEIVWRGMVLSRLELRFGQRRGWLLCTLPYGLAALPSAFTLADPVAGPNPLLVVAALGCGLFWSFAASLIKRLPPVIIAHMVFSYFMTTQFRPAGL